MAKCKTCNTVLSRYNPDEYCSLCKPPEDGMSFLFPDGQRRQRPPKWCSKCQRYHHNTASRLCRDCMFWRDHFSPSALGIDRRVGGRS